MAPTIKIVNKTIRVLIIVAKYILFIKNVSTGGEKLKMLILFITIKLNNITFDKLLIQLYLGDFCLLVNNYLFEEKINYST